MMHGQQNVKFNIALFHFLSATSILTITHSNRYLTYMQGVYRCRSFPHL